MPLEALLELSKLADVAELLWQRKAPQAQTSKLPSKQEVFVVEAGRSLPSRAQQPADSLSQELAAPEASSREMGVVERAKLLKLPVL